MELTFFIILIVLAVAFFIWIRIKESQYLKKKVQEVWSKEVAREIKKEKDDFVRRQKRFESALTKKQEKKNHA